MYLSLKSMTKVYSFRVDEVVLDMFQFTNSWKSWSRPSASTGCIAFCCCHTSQSLSLVIRSSTDRWSVWPKGGQGLAWYAYLTKVLTSHIVRRCAGGIWGVEHNTLQKQAYWPIFLKLNWLESPTMMNRTSWFAALSELMTEYNSSIVTSMLTWGAV